MSISFGESPLLDKVSMQVEKGERVCLLGRNGEGKTTLLKLISGEIKPDIGKIFLQKGSSIAGLSQELPAEKVRIKRVQPRKLTFREGKELEALPGRIELLEQEQKELYRQLADPDFYRGGGDRIAPAKIRVDTLQQELAEAYARWEELETIHHRDTV